MVIDSRGQGLKPRAVENLVKKYARFGNLDRVSPTPCGTASASTPSMRGNLVAVFTLLRHQQPETTAIDTPANQKDLEQAVSKLERDDLEAGPADTGSPRTRLLPRATPRWTPW